MEVIEWIVNSKLDSVVIAIITSLLTGIIKIPIKKLAQKTTVSEKITKFITFLPLVFAFGITVLRFYFFQKEIVFNETFYTKWLSAASFSLAIYAFWEKFVPSEKKVLSKAEINANSDLIEEIKMVLNTNKVTASYEDADKIELSDNSDNNSEKNKLAQSKTKKIILTNKN